ncbi:MAG: hypothetical protein ABR985_19935, partial [Methanotrichaceae archaeon]
MSSNMTMGSNGSDKTKVSSESNITMRSSGSDITTGSSGSNKTKVSSESNITMRSSGSDITTGSSGSDITTGSSGSNKTKVSSESNITMRSSGSDITTGSSGSNKTKVSNESSTTIGSTAGYLNPNTISSGSYPNFPWYSNGGSFFSQRVADTTFSQFRDYYTTSGMPVVGGIISTPSKFDIAHRTPSRIYYGTGQALPYTQYISTVPSGTNDLWVQGATSWAQYVVSPVGTWIQLVANAPVGGPAGFYEIVQTDTNTVKYNT